MVEVVILLLCGGTKSGQEDDIERAREIAQEWKESKKNDQEE
ncbi:hypothetical protein [Microlunatus parietis]|uniref:Putative component of toxin-antitoxin plasmid stabilization module n=1 Tax=Microlunatus parietis TaxID=682979 RepID=A0A7Y9I7I7_9ACTN|nr:hypothetical protein [Microlunatus parietis]NYE71741.1 putative component of toxin-antitoxin plasmid stabilization module [Microlunatus parietis]